LRQIAATVLKDIAKQLIKILVIDQSINAFKSIFNFGGGGGGGGLSGLNSTDFFKYANANGNVFAANGIVPYAMGGIVDRPTFFPFAKGIGLMGEAGPEAILPLQRGANGKLGVAGGGASTTINVSVDAKGSNVEGDGGKSNQLARVIAAAVQQEMIKQKRPGGILA
jgi:lambda family phage tail tape measure protein